MPLNEALYQVADELRAIASLGLRFSESGYDKGRYERILRISAQLVAALEDHSADEILQQYSGNFSHVSPLVAVEAAVFRKGKILLIRRQDNGLWAVPGGLSEVGETTSQAALRELSEEAGIH
jgi:8-oxo-dGTP pyrophosphatase MutT (NUDIX family)